MFKPGSTRTDPKTGELRTEEPSLVISSYGGWVPTDPVRVAYRTCPRYPAMHDDYVFRDAPRGAVYPGEREMLAADRALRPDLTLGRSDPLTRRIAEYARWVAQFLGGEPPP